MRAHVIRDALVSRSPLVVIITWCAALLGYWSAAPLWMAYGLAIIVLILALVVMAGRRRDHLETDAEEAKGSGTSWIAHELAGNGSPSGFYLLGFFGLVTLMLTGFQGAYALPAWAGLGLAVAWAIARGGYPSDGGPER